MSRRRRVYLIAIAFLPLALVATWFFSALQKARQLRTGSPPFPWAAAQRQLELWRSQGLRRAVEFHYVPLERISPPLGLAVLVGEDINFFGHRGFDLHALWEALQQWHQRGTWRGASTLTQQLAKSLFLSPRRTVGRKVAELRWALALEMGLSKRRILELYLNVAEFGPAVYGAEAASRHYFGCSAQDLSWEQAAALAASLPAPSRHNPRTATPRFQARKAIILRRMARADWLRVKLERLFAQPLARKP